MTKCTKHADRWLCPLSSENFWQANPPEYNSGYAQGESSEEPMMWCYISKKEFLAVDGDRTKTDTGWWNEYFQARERTLVKELGKLSP